MKRLMPIAAALVASAAPAPPVAVAWYAIVADDGAWIGHSFREVRHDDSGTRIVVSRELRLRNEEAGAGETRILDREEISLDAAGRTKAILSLEQTGSRWTRVEVTIDGNRAIVVRRTATARRASSVSLPPGTRFDLGEGLLAGWDPAARPSLEFVNFDADSAAVERVVIERLPGPANEDGSIAALRLRYDGTALVSAAKLSISRDGSILSTTQSLFGTGITTRVSDKETVLRPHAPYAGLRNAMVKSPFRIPESARAGHIRYRFGFRDGITFPLPETGEQRGGADRAGAVLDICSECGSGLPTDRAFLADALRPTDWLESDDRRIRALAEPVAKLKVPDARKMILLLERARPYLAKIDFVGHYTAVETLKRRAGDCTEAAVLLAALGRAAGIPTRVASGLVYSREQYHGVADVFMPHSWTLAYVDGAWRSFDLALDSFDSTHIALTIGDGDARSIGAARQLAGLLEWQGMTEVRTPSGG